MSHKASKTALKPSFSDVCAIAIHSTSMAYSLTWCLDDTFSTNFICEPDKFKINLHNDLNSYHVQYFFAGTDIHSRMWLVQNHGTEGKLFTSKPTPDYWLIIENESFYSDMNEWILKIKEIPNVQTAYIFPKENTVKLNWIMDLNHFIKD